MYLDEMIEDVDFPKQDKETRRKSRLKKAKKKKFLIKVINEYAYSPCIANVGRDSKGNEKYIKPHKNSHRKVFWKKVSSHKWRMCEDSPTKGNYYRRLFDYWWELD